MIQVETKGLDSVVKELKRLGGGLNKQIDLVLYRFSENMLGQIQQRSPVNETRPGRNFYRESWDNTKIGPNAYSIYNTRIHARVMEQGSPDPEAPPYPWPRSTTPLKKGQRGPSLTVKKKGKIWSKQTPEPVAGVVLEKAKWERLERDLVHALLGGLAR